MMNDAAASALLKTLEEPPPDASIVLTAVDPSSLPITIRSRCQTVTLQPVPAREIGDALQTSFAVDAARATELATLARGRPGWAVRAVADQELVESEGAARATVAALALQGPYSRIVALDRWLGRGSFLESRDRALDLLSRLEGWWRDALYAVLAVTSPELKRFLVGDAPGVSASADEIVCFLLDVQETAFRIEANVTARLAMEHLLGHMPAARSAAHVGS
jgi:DNA polymerase-3 subunit delta'